MSSLSSRNRWELPFLLRHATATPRRTRPGPTGLADRTYLAACRSVGDGRRSAAADPQRYAPCPALLTIAPHQARTSGGVWRHGRCSWPPSRTPAELLRDVERSPEDPRPTTSANLTNAGPFRCGASSTSKPRSRSTPIQSPRSSGFGETYRTGRPTEADAVLPRPSPWAPRAGGTVRLGRAGAGAWRFRTRHQRTDNGARSNRGTSALSGWRLRISAPANCAADAHARRRRRDRSTRSTDVIMLASCAVLVYEVVAIAPIARRLRAAVVPLAKARRWRQTRRRSGTNGGSARCQDVRGAVAQFQEVLRRSPHFAPAPSQPRAPPPSQRQPDPHRALAAAVGDDPAFRPDAARQRTAGADAPGRRP